MRRHAGVVLVIAAGLAACASDEAAEAFTVTDSAGVAIAVSHEPLWPEGGGWRLGGQPSVLIGGGVTDASAIVGPIAGAMRLPDGRILVADEGAIRLRWFADDGTILQSVGRKGEGPGEFRAIDALLHVGDSIAVVDNSLRRLSLFDLEGNLGRSITRLGASVMGRLASGEWIGQVGEGHSTGELSRVVRDSVTVWLLSDAGERVRRLAVFPGDETLVFSTSEVIGEAVPPVGRNTTIRFHDGQLWVGTGDEFRLDRWGTDGRLEQSVRWASSSRPLDQAAIDHVRDSFRTRFSDVESEWGAVGAEVVKALDSWTPPAHGPAFGSFRLDDGGNLWVASYALENSIEPVTWHVFDQTGRLQGDVVLPPLVVPTHISHDEMLGIWTDPDGAEHVVAYPLIRDSTPT